MPQNLSLRQRCLRVELLLVDVDGVLTEGGIVYSSLQSGEGGEVKGFHVRDGSGLKLWHALGKRSGVLTGRSSPLVAARAAELGVGLVVQGAADKLTAFERLLAGLLPRLPVEAVAYVGDDLPDVPVLRRVGLAVAVADACPEARAAAHYITRAPGGRGAVREVVDMLRRVVAAEAEAAAGVATADSSPTSYP